MAITVFAKRRLEAGGCVSRPLPLICCYPLFPVVSYCPQVPTAIDHSPSAGLVVTAHTDKLLRLWDPRTSEGQVMKSALSSHSNWVTCVAWHPCSAVHVLSGSVDKTACVWDVRPQSRRLAMFRALFATCLCCGVWGLLANCCRAGPFSIRHVYYVTAHARGVSS